MCYPWSVSARDPSRPSRCGCRCSDAGVLSARASWLHPSASPSPSVLAVRHAFGGPDRVAGSSGKGTTKFGGWRAELPHRAGQAKATTGRERHANREQEGEGRRKTNRRSTNTTEERKKKKKEAGRDIKKMAHAKDAKRRTKANGSRVKQPVWAFPHSKCARLR